MTTVRLGRERYAQHREIWDWLLDNVGKGGAWQEPMVPGHSWDWSDAFGHAFVRFRDKEHAVMFGLVWA